MAKIIVYRVENWQGEGPYRANYRTTSLNYLSGDDWDFYNPLPYSDGLPNLDKDDVCGFANFTAFFAWFGHTLRELSINGCFLCEFEIEERYVIKGRRQLIFKRDKAKLVSREHI